MSGIFLAVRPDAVKTASTVKALSDLTGLGIMEINKAMDAKRPILSFDMHASEAMSADFDRLDSIVAWADANEIPLSFWTTEEDPTLFPEALLNNEVPRAYALGTAKRIKRETRATGYY